ncbi:uncharacterized protein [Eurosta solidaginis]|uniref:uncharacterized protein n=1 Tax=Eurosta solidaginis TaxID=178769 RepID=UPI00353176AD
MRSFIILCLLAAAASDKLGYNYQPVAHSGSGLSFVPGGLSSGISGIGSLGGSSISGIAGSFGSGGGLGLGDASGLGEPSVGSSSVAASYSSPTQYEKEFFTYTAPEEDFNEVKGSNEAVNSLKKNIRVIFIKGPENRGLENAVINLAKHATEDKTAIYVLQKQSHIGDLANKLNDVQNLNTQKPEVHFIKYRTPQDAVHAQQTIQSQYDELSGNSQSYDGGVAPVLDFASQAPVQAAVLNAPANSYLPASVIRP